ncbi:Endoribonuclease L-PSP/chorismate mutase-like protein [Podospora didyma]|uniref:Endoribonuclease L-PSP/chorismate mutase-like protein n=1 Tax=Podospora didyma TaxID=330526 RepID=A0AAE0P014_9PEZI|nr:Endoribonuclease L-PSP/chorismate mutase-like protein [Podospora didyma]
MTSRKLISSGSPFEAQIGYSRAVVSGEFVFVSGCTGYDYKTGVIPEDVVAQTEQCMKNIALALSEAGASMADIVRVRYILPDRADFASTWPVLQKWLGDVRPAATMIQAGLMEEVMKIEVEVTAKKGSSGEASSPLLWSAARGIYRQHETE